MNPAPPTPELTRGLALSRALQLVCPRCGGSKLFTSWFRMQRACAQCGLVYEREPGYFLGSIYVNYGLTAMISTIAFVGLRFGAGVEGRTLLIPLSLFCIAFPLFFFRYARAYWLAMDCYFDRSEGEE